MSFGLEDSNQSRDAQDTAALDKPLAQIGDTIAKTSSAKASESSLST